MWEQDSPDDQESDEGPLRAVCNLCGMLVNYSLVTGSAHEINL